MCAFLFYCCSSEQNPFPRFEASPESVWLSDVVEIDETEYGKKRKVATDTRPTINWICGALFHGSVAS